MVLSGEHRNPGSTWSLLYPELAEALRRATWQVFIDDRLARLLAAGADSPDTIPNADDLEVNEAYRSLLLVRDWWAVRRERPAEAAAVLAEEIRRATEEHASRFDIVADHQRNPKSAASWRAQATRVRALAADHTYINRVELRLVGYELLGFFHPPPTPCDTVLKAVEQEANARVHGKREPAAMSGRDLKVEIRRRRQLPPVHPQYLQLDKCLLALDRRERTFIRVMYDDGGGDAKLRTLKWSSRDQTAIGRSARRKLSECLRGDTGGPPRQLAD